MKIVNVNLNNFRNLKQVSLEPGKNINIIYGNNAQGKTNILEAIWLFSGFRSFRNSRDNEIISFDA